MSRCRILIVDDEAVALRVLRVGLERGGYQVDSAANGQQALAAILEAPPDALITDIEMPMMSGEELCARLQKEVPERQFPIFVATSLTGLEHRDWSRQISNLHFLEKPLSVRKLLAVLNEFFARGSRTDKSQSA